MNDYCGIARKYIQDVLSGEIPACEHVKRACQRQLDDLERDWEYEFNEARASRVCAFIELLPHIKGEWAGKPIQLEPWQCFLLTTTFGWVDREGQRRFKTCYTEVPRKNAKSTLSSGVMLYMLACDGEEGAEVYSAATTREQARIVWADAKRMVEKCAGLRRKFTVETSAHAITVPSKASTCKALSRDQGGNLDGLNIHCAIIDELHAHKTRDVWEVIETGTGARRQPLVWAITTAGFNRAGICYEQRAYTLRILSGQVEDPEYFGIVYSLDDADDWTDPAVWAKANPNWGVSVKPDDIARKARKAQEMASAQNGFLTKHLNVWVNADTAWMDMRKWEACGDESLDLADFEGQPCWVGLDLATKTDIAAMVLVFPHHDGVAVFGKYYLPEETAEDGTNSQYQGWVIESRITATPGAATDFAYIEEDMREFARRFDIQCVAYDPWQASYLAQRLTEEGLPMVEYRQTVQNMSEPMKQLEAMVLEKTLTHAACPVLGWMMSNVVAHVDAKENIYPRKEFPQNKIDGVVALIVALGRYLLNEQASDLSAWLDDPIRVGA